MSKNVTIHSVQDKILEITPFCSLHQKAPKELNVAAQRQSPGKYSSK
jgi:hypothetical protein